MVLSRSGVARLRESSDTRAVKTCLYVFRIGSVHLHNLRHPDLLRVRHLLRGASAQEERQPQLRRPGQAGLSVRHPQDGGHLPQPSAQTQSAPDQNHRRGRPFRRPLLSTITHLFSYFVRYFRVVFISLEKYLFKFLSTLVL